MRIRPTVYAKAPFPREWCTRVDFITPLLLQASPKIASELEIYFLKTEVSYGIGKTKSPPKEPMKTRTGFIGIEERTAYSIPFVSSTNPSQRTYTQKEIFEDMVSSGISEGFDVPDAVIKERCSVIKKPKALETIPQLEEWDRILVHEIACSHYSKAMYGRVNIRLRSPAKMARDDLVEHYDFKYSDVSIKRMRSVLQMRSVIGLDKDKVIGWGAIYDPETKSNVSENLCDALHENKIFIDTAIPKELGPESVDGVPLNPILFLLKKHRYLISLKLGPEWSV